MDINLLFKIAAIGILVAVLYTGRANNSFNNGHKRNKYIIWHSKNHL